MQPCYRTKDKVKDEGTEFQGDFFFIQAKEKILKRFSKILLLGPSVF